MMGSPRRLVYERTLIIAAPLLGEEVKVRDKLLVRAAAADEDRDVTLDQQFEVILFIDNVFYAEEERGHLPFNFPMELTSLPPGEHVITVNVVTFGDQIGIGSRKIKTVR